MPAKLFPNFTHTHLIIHTHVSKLVFCCNLWVHSLGWMIRIRIINIRSLAPWCYKGTDELLPRMDLLVPLTHHDPSDLGSLILMRIQTIPKERIIVSATCSQFWLVHWIACGIYDWPEWLLWLVQFSNQINYLPITLLSPATLNRRKTETKTKVIAWFLSF